MPDPINRSAASQIASYGPPPEPLASQPPTASGTTNGKLACDDLPKKP